MRESRELRWGLALLAALGFAATVGGALWPIAPDRQLDPAVAGLAPPGARFAIVRLADGRELAARAVRRDGDRLELDRATEPRSVALDALAPGGVDGAFGSRRFVLGSDRFGRDVAARLLAGGRTSFAVALLALAAILAVGVPAGLAAAIAPPWADRLFLRLCEALQAFPRLFLLLALAAAFRPGLVAVALLLGLTGWVPMARLVRAEVRTLRTRDFVRAAEVAGAGRVHIAVRHLLPNAAAPIAVEASLAAAAAILSEASLSFLGFGLQPPAASWGNMIADGREGILLGAGSAGGWWVALFPGLAVVLAAIALNLAGEGLRDALDPRLASRSTAGVPEPPADVTGTSAGAPA